MKNTDLGHINNHNEGLLDDSMIKNWKTSELFLEYQKNLPEWCLEPSSFEVNVENSIIYNKKIIEKEIYLNVSKYAVNSGLENYNLPLYHINEPLQVEYLLDKTESEKALNEARLNSYQNLFEKAWSNLKQKFTKQVEKEQSDLLTSQMWYELEDLEDFDKLDFFDDFSTFEQKIGSSFFEFIFKDDLYLSDEFTELFYYRDKINEASKKIKVLEGIIKYLIHLFEKLARNKRRYYRRISSIPFKNLDDYHSLNFININ